MKAMASQRTDDIFIDSLGVTIHYQVVTSKKAESYPSAGPRPW
jgi:hypothetical protein